MLMLKNFFITKITRLTKAFVQDEKIPITRAVERVRFFRLRLIPAYCEGRRERKAGNGSASKQIEMQNEFFL